MTESRNNTPLYLLGDIVLLYLAGRILGPYLFANNWSFVHWNVQPLWYTLVWSAVLALTLVVWMLRPSFLSPPLTSRLRVSMSFAVLLAALFFAQSDSFVFGGGNLRVAQLAQTEYVIGRWFELGAITLADGIYTVLHSLDLAPNAAGVWAWKTLAYLGVILSVIGAWQTAKLICRERSWQTAIFAIIFFGPQAIVFSGTFGPEALVPPAVIWTAFFSLHALSTRNVLSIIGLWAVVAASVWIHHSLLFLAPAAVFLTCSYFLRSRRWLVLLAVSSVIVWIGLLCAIYIKAGADFGFRPQLLFLQGVNPFREYGIFSLRHMGDLFQILFLTFPQLIVVLFLAIKRPAVRDVTPLIFLSLLSIAGLTELLTLNPYSGIAIDFPRLAAYLTPLALLTAFIIAGQEIGRQGIRLAGAIGILGLFIAASYWPTYARTDIAEAYATNYLEQYPTLYRSGILAFRDVYYYNENYDKANEWEWKLTTKSSDQLLYQGTINLSALGKETEAIDELQRLKAKFPYWVEPRRALVDNNFSLGRFGAVKAEIDTCLMLEPFNKTHHENRFLELFNTREFAQALRATDEALELMPQDNDLLVNRMKALYYLRQINAAHDLAHELLDRDKTLAYPHLFLGLIDQNRGQAASAIARFKEFIRLTPEAPELPEVRKRLNDLELRGRSD